ncbi:MAG: DUF1211 domain-containing protein [Spirulina sp. SIO3F2]|nr:DUF1211 domain-containing protein [Spirulina sp. SIO3F2]
MLTETNQRSIQRLARLSDLIFAVAMTVMALTFETIPPEDLSAQQVTDLLQAQLPSLGTYALTFIVIAFYWTSHLHQFKHYQRTDTVHLWLTLLSLLFVVLLPYANALSNGYDTVFAVQVFYSLVAAGVGVFSTAAWMYATQNRRLVSEDLEDLTIRGVRQESYVEPLVSVLAIAGALIHPWGWAATFLLIPVILVVQSKLNTN